MRRSRTGYRPMALESEGSNCFSITQLSAPSSLFQKVAFPRPLTVKWSSSPNFRHNFGRQKFFTLAMVTKMVAAWSAATSRMEKADNKVCKCKLNLRNRKHVPCFYSVNYKHEWKFGRTRNAVGTRAAGERFHSFFEFSQTLYNSIETRSTCFLFLLENTTTRKRKTTC